MTKWLAVLAQYKYIDIFKILTLIYESIIYNAVSEYELLNLSGFGRI